MSQVPEMKIQRLEQIDRELARLVAARISILGEMSGSGGEAPTSILQEQQRLERMDFHDGISSEISSEVRKVLSFVVGATHLYGAKPSRVAYLGPEHSYSYLAACKFFGGSTHLQGVSSIGAVFEEVERGQARYGVVPIENSTDGRIVDTFTTFIERPVQICGEVHLAIHHNLLAKCPRAKVRVVCSKPQALSQCRRWLAEHLPGVTLKEVSSTTEAARIAAEEPETAAVASIQAGVEYGLDVLCESIEDNPHNSTRFAIIGKEQPAPTGNDKTSLLFRVPHRPGALADVMMLFKQRGINLTWIESFPVPRTSNEYFFFVELEGHSQTEQLAKAIDELKLTALRFDLLGSYPKGLADALHS